MTQQMGVVVELQAITNLLSHNMMMEELNVNGVEENSMKLLEKDISQFVKPNTKKIKLRVRESQI
jgi:DNA-directed RNA polymerase subunit E'/Rpb7